MSYASQDAEAAKRICDALRAAGVEVWFDAEGGLEHGDEWDAKIRRQIKECVLFLPIISANTQAREEGYFRIEWELAAQRALGIASGVAFILPIVIDDTKEPSALVPDRFRTVQWTRLRGGELTPDVLQRFLKLWSHRAGVVRHQAAEAPPSAEARPEALIPPRFRLMPVLGVVLGLVALGITVFIFLGPKTPAPSAPATTPGLAAPVAQADAFPRDPELRRARGLLYTMDAIPEDFRLAEDILKPVLARQPNDPETATVAAELNQEFLSRGFDNSAVRRAQAQRLTERAVQLAPDNPHALATLSRYLLFNGAQMARAEELIRKAISLRPDEARFHRTLHYILFLTRPAAETDAYGERMAAQFSRDPLVAYDIARRFKDSNDLVQMEKWFDRSLASETPVAFAMIWKAWLAAWAHGDLAAMKQWIDRVPDRQRSNTRVVNARYVHALLSGETRPALRALNELTDEWLTDFDLTVPKTLLIGNLALLEGRNDLARVQFEAALATVAAEVEKSPADIRPQRAKLWVLIGLGRLEEARAIQRILLQSLPRPYLTTITRATWTNPIISCLLLDLRADALSLLRDSSADVNCRRMLRSIFKLDPRLKPWRDDAEINALLRDPEPAAALAGSPPSDKSVAVLAFANLSDDKTNEYFSDGISEELLNVLAKVSGLKVSARTSAFYFKGKEVPIPEIAQKLGVAYVVEGSVRKAGDKVRITAQLIKAADGFHLWSDTFTRDLKDIFAVQDEIAGLIAQQLQLKLGDTPRATKVVNPEAHRLVLEGWHFWNLRTEEGFARAEAAFKQALVIDPQFAQAHAGLAHDYVIRAQYRLLDGIGGAVEDWALGRAEAQKAIDLDPMQAEPYVALAYALANEGHWRDSEQLFQKAFALNPNYAMAHLWHSQLLASQGQLDLSLEEHRRAIELDPLSFIIIDRYAEVLRMVRQFSEGLEANRRAADLRREIFIPNLGERVMLLLELGHQAEAVEVARAIRQASALRTRWNSDSYAILTLERAGLKQEAADYAAQLIGTLPAENYARGFALVALGRFDEALPSLEHLPPITRRRLFWDTLFDPWREDPRFQQLLVKLGCTEEYKVARATLARMQQEQAAKK